jgi:hypothetical protein
MTTRATKWIERLALCSALGIVVTIAVAWGCEVSRQPFGGATLWSMRTPGGEGWSYWVDRRQGTLRIYRVFSDDRVETWIAPAPWRPAPRWSAVHEPASAAVRQRQDYVQGVERASGWPFVAMRSDNSSLFARWPGTQLQDGWEVRPPVQADGEAAIILPLRPIWPSFAIDVMAYGAAAFMLLFGPGFVRRAMRRRRGACVRCGYDLRGTTGGVCPECGRALD